MTSPRWRVAAGRRRGGGGGGEVLLGDEEEVADEQGGLHGGGGNAEGLDDEGDDEDGDDDDVAEGLEGVEEALGTGAARWCRRAAVSGEGSSVGGWESPEGLGWRCDVGEGEAGGLLLGLLLGGCPRRWPGRRGRLGRGGAGDWAGWWTRTSTWKRFWWSGPDLAGEDVLGLAEAGGLEVLLQGGLVVADGAGEGAGGVEGEGERGQRRGEDVAVDEGGGGGRPASR